MDLAILSALNAERAARRATLLVTHTASGAQRLVREADIGADPLADVLRERLRTGRSGMAETPTRSFASGTPASLSSATNAACITIGCSLGPMITRSIRVEVFPSGSL